MDEQTIAKVQKEVGRLDLADHILAWDKKQAKETVEVTQGVPDLARGDDGKRYRTIPNPDARRCQENPEHGTLQMHASGAQLMCCVTRPTPCEYAEPVSR